MSSAVNQNTSWQTCKSWFLKYFTVSIVLTVAIGSLYFWNLHLIPENGIAWCFLIFYSIGHFGLLGLLTYVPFLLFLYLAWSLRAHRVLMPIVFSSIQTLLFVDSVVFSQYRFHINGMVLDLLFHGEGQVIHFDTIMWLWLAGVWILILFMNLFFSERIYKKIVQGKINSIYPAKRYIFGVILSFIGSQFLHAEADSRSYSPVTQLAGIYPLALAGRFDSVNSQEKVWKTTVNDFTSMIYPTEPLQCHSVKDPLNVLVVVIDALRADMLDTKVMPNLSHLAKQSLIFRNHFSGSNETRGGIFSLFYGLPAFFFEPMRLQKQGPVLIGEFLKSNYQMGIFSSAPLVRPEFDQTVFKDVPNLRLRSQAERPALRDQEILDEWIKFTESASKKKPVFGFLFFDSVHGYDFPDSYPRLFQPIWAMVNYFELNNNFNPLPFINRYKTSASYVDHLLKQIIESLKEQNLFNNTVVIITSDHGQEFNDNGLNYWGHNSNFTPVQTHVPLVIHWPGQKPREFLHRTAHYDIAPTLIKNIFSCTNGSETYSFGEDLFQEQSHQAILMGYPNHFGVLFEQEIILTDPIGRFEVLDLHYKPMVQKEYNRKILFEELSKLSRFNKH